MSDRSVRSLVNLESTASTARTLNLNAVWKRRNTDPNWRAHPMFHNPVLNRAIIVKHRLRRNEQNLFSDGRQTVTKVILPINDNELKFGARYFFIGQRGYAELLEEIGLNRASSQPHDVHDNDVLKVLDELPSLDPFLMREVLARRGYRPDRYYFDISEADVRRMFSFLRDELKPLIGLSFDDLDTRSDERTAKLATKILANSADAEMEPLRIGLGMTRPEFQEGVFCWKGFIYYKWVLNDLLPKIKPVADEIAGIRPFGPCDLEDRLYIEKTRAMLDRSIRQSCSTVRKTLKVYEDAYADLTKNGKPEAFREFLLTAPAMFYQLGERLGAVQHIMTFWRYRFPERTPRKATADELIDIFMDFEGSISAIETSVVA